MTTAKMFDKHGKFLAKTGVKGNGIGQFSNLHGLAFDNETRLLYVADMLILPSRKRCSMPASQSSDSSGSSDGLPYSL